MVISYKCKNTKCKLYGVEIPDLLSCSPAISPQGVRVLS